MTHRTNLFDFERDAEGVLDIGTFGYYYSGADDEVTKRENRAAFENVQLLPRMLVGVAERDTSTTVLGQKLGMPVVIAPMALAKMAHADGEPGMARAAADFGVPTALSTMSTTRLEDVAAAASAPMWFQLYVYKDRAITEHLVKRAEAAGYQALVLTVDVPVIGNRERDVRNEFKVAAGIQLANLVDFALQDIPNEERDSALGKYISEQVDPSLAWRDVDWLASITSLPILVKGILRADDAQKALDHGAKGIVVSNHGGRQLDTAISTFNALQMIAPTVGDRMEILMDGGVRRGTDILKALALGAKAVMVGRPIMYGLAVGGESGVREVLRILHREFDAALALCGCRTVTDITPDLILR
jgi:4-hydroxymandelate oxidase